MLDSNSSEQIITYEDGSVYKGGVSAMGNNREGKGEMVWKDGSKYIG